MNKEQKKTSLFAHWGRKMHTSSKGPIRSVARDNTIAGFLKVTMFNIPGLAGGNQVVDTATGSLHKAIGVSLRIKDYVRFGTAFITNRLIKGWANLTGQERKGANRAVYNPVSHTMNGKKVEILSKQPQRW